MWSRDDQKITCAQNYEHPFNVDNTANVFHMYCLHGDYNNQLYKYSLYYDNTKNTANFSTLADMRASRAVLSSSVWEIPRLWGGIEFRVAL